MNEIELHPGTPFCTSEELNRIARQQGLCLAIAQASIFDEICRSIELPEEHEADLVNSYCLQNNLHQPEQISEHLQRRGWQQNDLLYFATKQERLRRFQQLMFAEDVELRFLSTKNDLDTIWYSLLRSRDGNLAFELHQRLLEGEADFEELAATFSEGPERDHGGKLGPVPLSQAHPVLVEKLRISQPGQMWEPFFLKDIWVILRLDEWQGARLDDLTRQQLLQDIFDDWLHERAIQLLNGEQTPPLPKSRFCSKTFEPKPHNEPDNGGEAIATEATNQTDDIKKRLQKITQLSHEEDKRLAVHDIDQLLTKYPKDLEVLVIANNVHRLAGNSREALKSAEKLIKFHKDFFDGYARAAQDLLSLDEAQNAVEVITQGLEKHPENYWILTTAIRAHIAAENYEQAATLGESLYLHHPKVESFDATELIAKSLRRRGRFEESRWHLYRSLQNAADATQRRHITEDIYHLDTQSKQAKYLPRSGCDVLCIASDEAPYIHEFIHHYIYLGFKNIFIGTNNCSDNTVEIIKKINTHFPQVQAINVDNTIDKFRQWGCYHRLFDIAIETTTSQHCLIVDVDEFWIADPFPLNIDDFIKQQPHFDAFSFHWVIAFDDETFSKPFGSDVAYVKDPWVKSLVNYTSPIYRIGVHGPNFNLNEQEAVVRIGSKVNVNIEKNLEGISVTGMCSDPTASTQDMDQQAWIAHRAYRSEIEYSSKLFKVHANDDTSQVGFKSNRYGWNSRKNFRVREDLMNDYIDKIMPADEVKKYHQSLDQFTLLTGISKDLKNAREAISEEKILENISLVSPEILSRDAELIKQIFRGTRFLEVINNQTAVD